MIYLKTPEEIEKMRQACTLVSRTLGEVAKWVAPGVTTRHLDNIAREFMLDNGGRPACLGYGGFPATLCIEIKESGVAGFRGGGVLRAGGVPRGASCARATSSVSTQWSNSTAITATCAIRFR